MLQSGLQAQPHKKQLLSALQNLEASECADRLLQRAPVQHRPSSLGAGCAEPQQEAPSGTSSSTLSRPAGPRSAPFLRSFGAQAAREQAGPYMASDRVPAGTYPGRRDPSRHQCRTVPELGSYAAACAVLGVPSGAGSHEIRYCIPQPMACTSLPTTTILTIGLLRQGTGRPTRMLY